MTTHLIEYEDVAYLGYNTGYLERLPERIEAFKIKLDLVPPSEYGKHHEPVLNQTVSVARQGSTLWRSSAAELRSLHQETRATLTNVIVLMEAAPSARQLRQVALELQRHAAAFRHQQTECDRIIECAIRVVPRFIDFMNVRSFEYAKRKGLLTQGGRSNMPETLNSALTDEQSLASARGTIGWNHRAFSTAILSAGNMGAYCSRICGLLEATLQQLKDLNTNQTPRRLRVSCQSTASCAREAQRLINYTFDHILRFSI